MGPQAALILPGSMRLPAHSQASCAIQLINSNGDQTLRNLLIAGVAISSLIGAVAHADTSTNDKVFANAALRELHNLAVASAQSEQAAKDSDDLGCRDAMHSIQEAAHEALKDMHYMSFTPIDAIGDVSSLLRLSHLALPNGCPNDFAMSPMVAGKPSCRSDGTTPSATETGIQSRQTVTSRPRTHSATSSHSQIRTTLGSTSGRRVWESWSSQTGRLRWRRITWMIRRSRTQATV